MRERAMSGDEDAEEGVTYQLIVPFVTGDPMFARGWEAGRLYQQMRQGETPIRGCYRALNDEQHFLTAKRMGYTAELLTTPEDGWVEMEFRKKEG